MQKAKVLSEINDKLKRIDIALQIVFRRIEAKNIKPTPASVREELKKGTRGNKRRCAIFRIQML